MYRKFFFALVPVLLFFLFITAPMLLMSQDMWDGTIVEYASKINNYSGLKSYFVESTWFLQYPLSVFLIEVAQATSLSYKDTNALFVFLIALFLFRETFCLCKYQFKFSDPASYYAVTLIATFSTWGVLFSSIMTFHFGCIVLGLFSIRMIHKASTGSKFFGYLTLIVSLSLQSQLVFLPVLSYLYDSTNQNSPKYLDTPMPSKKTIFVFSVSLAVFVFVNLFFPAHGIYENYNSFIGVSPEKLMYLVLHSIMFGTYLVPMLAIIGLFFSIMLSIKRPVNVQTNIISKIEHLKPSLLLILFIAGVLPYVVVGKFSHFLDIFDWTNRHGILLALPASLFAALCFEIMYKISEYKLMKTLVVIGSTVLLTFQISLMTVSLAHKLNRQIFVSELESAIRLSQEELLPGALEIIGKRFPPFGVGKPGPHLRSYELNFLMYRATGKSDWYMRIGREQDASFTIPCYIRLNRNYQLKYIYNYDSSHDLNHTIVDIEVSGYDGLSNIVRNILGINDSASVELVNVYTNLGLDNRSNEVCN